ncbi:MAG: cytochrome P450 [Myxococcales bacterium]|nr:cytochrome P450 [Myxococcales bacterium]
MQFSDIPALEGGKPYTGHFDMLNHQRLEMMAELAASRRDVTRLRFPGQWIVAVNGAEVLEEVLVSKAKSFEKSPVLRTALHPLAGDGLFTSEGELWRRQRKLMSPMFRVKEIHRYAAAMAECAERGAASFRDGEVIDAARETTRIAMSVAGKTLFDADTFSEADELGAALTTALTWANEQISSPVLIAQARLKTFFMVKGYEAPEPVAGWCRQLADKLHPPVILPGPRRDALRDALKVLEARVDHMIAARRAAAEPPPDLLTQLLAARDEDGDAMSDRQVRDEILTLFVAGHETTASGLAWALYYLAKAPAIYGEVEAEVDRLRGEHITFHDVAALPLCSQVFKEALRIQAPIYLYGRQAIEPVTIGGYELARGTIVLVSPWAVHRRPDYWPEPEVFRPSRFSAEEEQARPRGAYLPFSDGPRTCIGNHFALLEGPIVLATLLRRARFTLVGDAEVEPEAGATLRPGGVPLRVELRPSAAKMVTEQSRSFR